MDALEESLIDLEPDISSVSSTDDKANEPCSSLGSILDDKLEGNKSEEVLNEEVLNPIQADSVEETSELNKTNCIIDIKIDTEEQAKEDSSMDLIDERIEEAKSNLSEFLKVGNDPLQNAVVLNDFEDNLESERDKIIEDLISTTESTNKEDLLTYTAHFDVLNSVKDDNKAEDVNMDIDNTLNKSEEQVEMSENIEKQDAEIELNVEEKIKQLLVDKNDDEQDEINVNLIKESTDAAPTSVESLVDISSIKNDTENKDTSKDDIDTLLSTLMPDLQSSIKPDDIPVPKKQSIQYLREVLDKSDDRGTKRKISTDSDPEDKVPKKAKALPILPEVTLTKVASKKRNLKFDDLMSNLTKIKLPSASWKVRISAGSNPFSIVEFHEKEKLLRSVKFFKEDFHFKVLFNNLPVELLGAPEHVCTLDDVSVLLNIVNTLIKNDPIVNYL